MRKTLMTALIVTVAMNSLGRVICSGDSAPVSIDSRVAPVFDSVAVAWDAAWIGGDANATVAIADNGTEVRRTTGAGAFTHTLTGDARHELTYTTYIGGVAQDEVYAATVYAKWKYEVVDGGAVITETTQTSGSVTIPAEIDGYPVTGIARGAFQGRTGLTSVVIPHSVCDVAEGAFVNCTNLRRVEAARGLKRTFEARDVFAGCPADLEIEYVETATISGVTAKQRFPWNGKVDITYTLTGDVTAGLPAWNMPRLSVTASNRVDGTTYSASASALSGETGTTEGSHHVVWDLNAQGLEIKSDEMVFALGYYVDTPKPYCVIDLSGGANASSYPVLYLADVPSGGFSTDEYKTTKLVLRLIEPGPFMMNGSYSITLTKPFYCGIFEVTQRQWELVTGSNPCSSTSYGKGDSYPVHYVSYNMIRGSSAGAGWPESTAVDGNSFLGKLQARTGIDFDLPTEAQWEYACRAGTTTTYSYGNSVDGNYMWYSNNSSSKSHVVGTKQPNAWGLYDMHGNVWEWCLDWYGSLSVGMTDPVGSSSGSYRVRRGGSWSGSAGICTSSYRYVNSPSDVIYYSGFRLVRTLSNTEGERRPEAVAGAERAVALCTAEAAPVAIDSRLEPVVDSINISWNASWVGGNVNATVAIAVNGTEVKRATGTGEFTYTLFGGGRHELTYTTYIDGMAQSEVYATTVYAPYGVVVFDANGGSVDESCRDVASGCVIGELPVPIRAGYTFAGWWTSPNGGTRISASTTVKDNMTYYAHWTIKSHTVTFDANGGTGGTSTRQNYGTAIVAPTVARTGYTFTGWSPAVADTVPDNDVTYTAQWQVNQYTVTFDANGGVGGMSVTQDYDTAVTAPDVRRENYMLTGWSPVFPGTMPAENTTYVAQWLCEWRCVTNADDTLTITGVNFTPVGVVVIPSVIDGCPVTGIGPGVFNGCDGLTSVTIPEGVVSLGARCFDGCDSLTNVTFMSEATSLGNNDLRTVGRLFELRPDGYWVVQGALVGFKGECPATIPDADGLVRVMPGALEGCTALTGLTFSAASMLTSIGTNAFKGCTELQTLVLPPSLVEIGDEAFMGCSYLDNVIVPGSVKRVGARAFKNCTGFTAAQIEHGVESLGDEAFYGDWRIAEVDIPSTVTNIGVNAFGGDSSIIRVGLRGDVRPVSEIFSNYQYIREATVKEGTGSIKANLFNGCSQLEDVHFFGNSPNLGGVNIYMNTPSTLTSYVARDSTGWDGTPGSHALPQAWPLSGSYRRSIAWWDAPTYLVQFDSNGGTLGVQDTYQRSERLFVLPPEPVQTGYTFAGWWTKPSGGLRVTADTVFIEGVYTHLYAHWMKPYRVFLDPDGGTVTNGYVIYLDQTVYGVLPAAVRTGYAFGGWRYNGRTILPDTHITTSAEHTLTAQWEAYQYSIQFDSNGGAGLMSAQPMVYDEAVPLASNQFTKPGSLFRGWATASDGAVAYREQASVMNLTAVADDVVTLYAVWQEKPASVLACEDAFGGAGTVTLDEDDSIVVTLTNDVSGTVEIPDNVGAMTIDLNGHNMVGDGGLGETALPGGPAILIVAGEGEGDATRLAIVDTSEGEKGQIAGGGESVGIEVAEDAATGVKLDVEEGVGVFNGDGTEQELKPKLEGAGKVVVPKSWKVGQKVTWKATADKGSVFARWEGPLVDSLNLARNERRNPSLAFAVPEGFETNMVTAVFIPLDDDGLYTLGITQTEFGFKEAVSDVCVTDDSHSYVTATASGLPSGLKFDAKKMCITGAPTKGGVYWVQIKAKNASGYQWAENVKVTVSGDGKEAKEPKLTRTAYHPLTVICATEGGTVSGTGVYAEGKKVTIKATAAKGHVFAGWYETASAALAVSSKPSYLSLAASMNVVVPEMRYVFAKFVTAEADRDSIALAVDGEKMRLAGDGSPHRTNIWAGVYMEWPVAAGALSETKVKVAGLPSGLKFTDKPVTSKIGSGKTAVTVTNVPAYTIYGAPTAASKTTTDRRTGEVTVTPSAVKITVTTAGKSSKTYQIDTFVDALPAWAVGTFDGVSGDGRDGARPSQDDADAQERVPPEGLVTLTVAANGKISGKVIDADGTWTLSAASFDGVRLAGDGSPHLDPEHQDPETGSPMSDVGSPVFHATVIGKSGKEVVTNEVTVAAEEMRLGEDASPHLVGVVSGATVGRAVPGEPYSWTAWQNLWKTEPWKTDAKPFAKAPALAIDAGTRDACPYPGTVTLKFASSGSVTASGKFVTGQDAKGKDVVYSASCSSVLIPAGGSAYTVYLYFPPKAGKFEGYADEVSLEWDGAAFEAVRP